jgi:pyruvate formate lyase activating enzyme
MLEGKRVFDHHKCDVCGLCVSTCRVDALGISGTDISADSLVDLLMRDYDYYKDSNGGVTFSGGEPFLQTDFLVEVGNMLKQQKVSIAVDTALNLPWSTMEPLVGLSDLLLVDIKSMDRETHYRYTGVYPDLIRRNLQKLRSVRKKCIVRMPLISEVNDSDAEITDACAFLQGWDSLVGVELLPYHDLGVEKAKNYQGAIESQEQFETPTSEKMWKIAKIFKGQGIPIVGTYGGGEL